MNKFIGIGNLCKDIELRETSNGRAYISNTIAIKNDFKNADGKYDSEFINIQVWGRSAEYLSKYAEKGTKIAVEGRINTRSYDKSDGTKGYKTDIVCNSVELLGSKSNDDYDSDENIDISSLESIDFEGELPFDERE